MKIFDANDNLILQVDVDDKSYRSRAIMADHNLVLYYELPEHVEIPVGAYCEFEGETYFLMRPEHLKMKHTRLYEYTVTFSSDQEKTKIWKMRNPADGRLKFPLTAKPKEHLQMVVDNMNRRDPGWTVGDCIDEVEKLVSYDHDYCWDALTKIASEFKTEFEIERKRISLHKVEYDKSAPLRLAYGVGKGFKSGVGRSNSGDHIPTEILFVQGGDRNIDRSKYPADEKLRALSNGCLLLPPEQTIAYDGRHFDNEEGFNPETAHTYKVDDLGLSIRNISKELATLAEDSLDRSDDYPKRVGKITEVVEVNKDKNFYDFIDTSIPEELNYEDYLIGENEMTVIFQSGKLAGREFGVKYHHRPTTTAGKQKAGRRFEIVPQEIDGVLMPGASFVPRAGDTYAIFNVMLPDSYIRNDADKSGASWDMFRAAVKHLFDNEQMKYTFSGELDGIWAKKDWFNIGGKIRLGGFVRFFNEQFAKEGVLVRIISIKDYINNPHSPKIELSNETISGGVASTLKQLESTEVVIDNNHRAAIQFTKRRFRDAKETIEMIEAALADNFTSRINPIAVETMSMLVGDESLQYQFVAKPGSSKAVSHNVSWDTSTKQLISPQGTIQHLTLGIDSIRPNHDPDEYKYWEVEGFKSARLDDATARFYLYICAEKEYDGIVGKAVFRIDTEPHKLEEGALYWFLVGVLNSEYDGDRSFASLYGFTEILPGRITANRLLASDGDSYFDMLNSALKLGDRLQFNTKGDGQLRVKGTIVQSQSGDESYIGCYRGDYDSATTYFNGDEVTYTDNELTSFYRFVADTPKSGIPPTSSLYWQVIARGSKGKDGQDGTSIKVLGTFFEKFASRADYLAADTTRGRYYLIDHDEQLDKNCVVVYTSLRQLAGVGYKTTYTPAENGDAYVFDTDGHLYIAGNDGWVDGGQIRGEDGRYTEMRFAANGSTTTPPALTQSEPNPAGWSIAMPLLRKGYFLWMTRAVKTSGGTLISEWSAPVRLTAADGKDGKDAASPAVVYRGVYDESKTYYGNEYRLDAVRHPSRSEWFIARVDAGTFSAPAPPDKSKWNPFGANFESVATDLLLAVNANVGGWIFRNGRLESETQTSDGDPMAFLDGKTGSMRLNGTMQLSCAYEGQITDVNLFWLPEVKSTKRMTMGNRIEDIGKVCRLYNSGKYGSADYRIICHTFGIRPGLTDVSFGTFEAILRPGEVIELTCFKLPPGDYDAMASWQLTGRFGMENYKQSASTGRFPRMIALGRIHGSDTYSEDVPVSGRLFDGTDLGKAITARRIERGRFAISAKEGILPSRYRVFCTGYGGNYKGAITNDSTAGFTLLASDDDSLNDADIEIMILDDLWWYDYAK